MRKRAAAPLEAGEDRQFVTAIARGFEILHAFEAEDPILGNQELAERTGLPRATVSRLTYTLTRLGYLTYLPRFGKYQLGLGVVPLGQLALANMGIRRLAAPLMRHLAGETNASVSLGRRDGLSMLYVEHVSPRTAVAVQLEIGSRVPIGLTAMGRAYYAASPEAERRSLDDALAARYPQDWPRIQQSLAEGCAMRAAHGFTLSAGDWTPTVHAAGAAVTLPGGEVFALNCGAPAFMLEHERLVAEVGPRLAAVARRIESLASGPGRATNGRMES
ncbi:IclR family transcriptional regulator [Roseomonas sp. SSH11]|uniref:IclR family transcriptional regulator n=1 Tax=Pararoseomonas baculiformis TaxID=2820812 RepID=A0ABS4ABD4_9PROT|nr:IclR family transcriptional regulator [Pararoseomonas baculiformis]MBP0444176.1 IclR family transcriptional regulator [Pararoseomonas baculiformis]